MSTKATLQLAVCGLHLKGQPLHQQLLDLGGTLVRACKSAPVYRLYAISKPPGAPCTLWGSVI